MGVNSTQCPQLAAPTPTIHINHAAYVLRTSLLGNSPVMQLLQQSDTRRPQYKYLASLVLWIDGIHLSDSSSCIVACFICSNNLHLVGRVAVVYAYRTDTLRCLFDFDHQTLIRDEAGRRGWGATPRPRTLTLCFTSLQVNWWCS